MSSTSHTLSGPASRRRRRVARPPFTLDLLSRWVSKATVVVAIFAAAAVAGLFLYGYSHRDRFYEGVSIAGVPVGGMSQTEAREKIASQFDHYLDASIVLTSGDQTFPIKLRDAGIELDLDATISQSFARARSGSWWARSRAWASAVVHGRDLPLSIRTEGSSLDERLAAIAPAVTKPVLNATVEMDGANGPTIVPEQNGISLDVTSTNGEILRRLETMSVAPVPLVTSTIPAAVTAASLQPSIGNASQAVQSQLVVTALDKSWGVTSDDLKRIVSVDERGQLTVNRDAVASLVRNISKEIEHPSVDADVDITKNGEIVVVPGAQSVDVTSKASVDAIVAALESGMHDVPLVVTGKAPKISDAQAATAVARARALVDGGMHLTWTGGSADLTAADLAGALTVGVDPDRSEPFSLGWDTDVLAGALGPVEQQIDIPAKDARFRLVDGKVTLAGKSANGQRLDTDAAVAAIKTAAGGNGPREVALTIKTTKPTFTESALKKIKVPDVIGDSSTYYGESSDARRKNIEVASKLETGWLVPPGGQFSYAEFIGMVTKDQGFVTGFGIVADPSGDGSVTTAPVVGGGICQVSTTIFQAAFWAGLQPDERYEHPYWLQTYGEPPRGMKGLDAMVNIEPSGSLDMKFTNTTGSWIAVVINADSENVKVEIRGVHTGWTVQVDQPVITDVIPADDQTYYTESPELPAGEEMQVEHAQEGFTATVHRTVTDANGNVVDDTTLTSTYGGSRNTILRGTGSGASQ